jgi:FixJ family two-component response regulator
MEKQAHISIVDDDQSVREALPDFLAEFGYAVEVFASGEEFLASDALWTTDCLILDLALVGMSGTDIQEELSRRGSETPIVFITAHGDETVRPQLMDSGAIECLFKPFTDVALLDAINLALKAN